MFEAIMKFKGLHWFCTECAHPAMDTVMKQATGPKPIEVLVEDKVTKVLNSFVSKLDNVMKVTNYTLRNPMLLLLHAFQIPHMFVPLDPPLVHSLLMYMKVYLLPHMKLPFQAGCQNSG